MLKHLIEINFNMHTFGTIYVYSVLMKSYVYLSTIIALIFISGCKSGEKSASSSKSEKKPDWIVSRPVDGRYYHGVGVAMVNNYTQNHVESAKQKALNDIVSEISVSVSTSSRVWQFENNDELIQEYQSLTDLKMKNEIEGYELVDSWGNESEYWVYYRLSKEKYNSKKLRELASARNLATQYYEEGLEAENKLDISKAVHSYIRGFNALKDHLDADVMVLGEHGKINLTDQLISKLIDLFGKISIVSNEKGFKTQVSRAIDKNISVVASYREDDGSKLPISGLQLRPYFSKGAGEMPSHFNTSTTGEGQFRIKRVTGNQSIQALNIGIDFEGLSGATKDDNLVARILKGKTAPPEAVVNVEIERIVAFLETDEQEFGKPSANNTVSNAIKKHLSEKAFTFKNDKKDVDVYVKISVNSKEGEKHELNNFTLFNVYLDCFVTIINASNNQQIYYKGFSQEKGTKAYNYGNALKDAEANVLERFESELLPEINNLDL